MMLRDREKSPQLQSPVSAPSDKQKLSETQKIAVFRHLLGCSTIIRQANRAGSRAESRLTVKERHNDQQED
jgi:hypothetical protein